MSFKFETTPLAGLYVITPFYMNDNRGQFMKDYNIDEFKNAGIDFEPKEEMFTQSKKGTIRGMHFQRIKEQGKLIRCVQGKIYDYVVDMRKNSKTYLKGYGITLTPDDPKLFLVPRGFAHGYIALEDSIVCYRCDEVFYKEYDGAVRYDDHTFDIKWPYEEIGGKKKVIISEKDSNAPEYLDLIAEGLL